MAEAAQFAQDWAVQGPGPGGAEDDEDEGFGASLLRSRRSKFTPKSRDVAAVSVNDRSNLLFEGARPSTLPERLHGSRPALRPACTPASLWHPCCSRGPRSRTLWHMELHGLFRLCGLNRGVVDGHAAVDPEAIGSAPCAVRRQGAHAGRARAGGHAAAGRAAGRVRGPECCACAGDGQSYVVHLTQGAPRKHVSAPCRWNGVPVGARVKGCPGRLLLLQLLALHACKHR